MRTEPCWAGEARFPTSRSTATRERPASTSPRAAAVPSAPWAGCLPLNPAGRSRAGSGNRSCPGRLGLPTPAAPSRNCSSASSRSYARKATSAGANGPSRSSGSAMSPSAASSTRSTGDTVAVAGWSDSAHPDSGPLALTAVLCGPSGLQSPVRRSSRTCIGRTKRAPCGVMCGSNAARTRATTASFRSCWAKLGRIMRCSNSSKSR